MTCMTPKARSSVKSKERMTIVLRSGCAWPGLAHTVSRLSWPEVAFGFSQ